MMPGAQDELRALLDGLREETLTTEQGRRLEALLREDGEALKTYIRTVAMQADLRGRLVGWVGVWGADELDGPDGTAGAAKDPAAAFQDSIYGQPVCEVIPPEGNDEEEPLALPALPPSGSVRPGGWLGVGARTWAGVAGVAAVLVIGLGIWLRGAWRARFRWRVRRRRGRWRRRLRRPSRPRRRWSPRSARRWTWGGRAPGRRRALARRYGRAVMSRSRAGSRGWRV